MVVAHIDQRDSFRHFDGFRAARAALHEFNLRHRRSIVGRAAAASDFCEKWPILVRFAVTQARLQRGARDAHVKVIAVIFPVFRLFQ
jgi:hypothetical protein